MSNTRIITFRAKPTNPRHLKIMDWIDRLPSDNRGKLIGAHIEQALIDYIESEQVKARKSQRRQKNRTTTASLNSDKPEKPIRELSAKSAEVEIVKSPIATETTKPSKASITIEAVKPIKTEASSTVESKSIIEATKLIATPKLKSMIKDMNL